MSSEPTLIPPALYQRWWRFARLAFGKAWQDHLLVQSAALAFVTVLSLIPLLAVFSVLGAQFFSAEQERIVELLRQVLPYSEETLIRHLEDFINSARTLRGLGFGALLLASTGIFSTVELTFNRIWNTRRQRPLGHRLLIFTLLLFWGPVVLGATYSGFFLLGRQPGFQGLAGSLPLHLLASFLTLVALTLLYWMVPFTRVDLRSAVWGGLVATLLLELLRRSFGLFVGRLELYSTIYGAFGLALFFMFSIQLTWWLVLLGAEITYCLQHPERIARPVGAGVLSGPWPAMAAVAVVLERFGDNQPITPAAVLAERLRLDAEELRGVLEPLVEKRILSHHDGDDGGYLLSCDPYRVELSAVLDAYESRRLAFVEPLPENLAANLRGVWQRLHDAQHQGLDGLTLAGLLLGEGVTEPPKPAPSSD